MYIFLIGNYAICSDENKNILQNNDDLEKNITFKRLDPKDTHPDNIVYSYNQGVDFIKKYPNDPNLPKNQITVSNFLNYQVKNFLDNSDMSSMNLLRTIRQNCMVNSSLFSNNINENYVDGDTALLVTMNSKNFNNMNCVMEECQKNKINLNQVVLLDISKNQIENITTQDLSFFPNLQALLVNTNNLHTIDITKNPFLSVLACQQNQLTKALNIMQIMKQKNTPSFVNFIENKLDDNELRKILDFIYTSQKGLQDEAEMVSYYYGLKKSEQNELRQGLPIMIYAKCDFPQFFKLGNISTASDNNLGELLIFDKGIIQNHIINRKFKITGFRNFFRKHVHKELNYQQRAAKRFICISLMLKFISQNHILNFVNNHGNLNIHEILEIFENFLENKNNNNN